MNIILTRSPYIIPISGTGVVGGLVEIFLWKQGASYPSLPQYTLSKLTPATNVTKVNFDVSPYINEYITNLTYAINGNVLNQDLDTEIYTNVNIKRYKLVGTTYTLIDSIYYSGFKGYAYQKDGINVNPSPYLLDPKTYYYHYDSSENVGSLKPGDIAVYNSYTSSYNLRFKYTNLVSGATVTNTITEANPELPEWKQIYKVYPTYWADGNKLEIIDNDTTTVLATYYFKPQEECKYSPVILDFINRFGAWQREFLFKNSTDSLNIENQSYKNYRVDEGAFNAQEGLVITFNTNGNESIKTNTGWVNEDFKDTIKQILLSDRILVNNSPATITTKQVDLQKNINNKLINYALDFNFSNPLI